MRVLTFLVLALCAGAVSAAEVYRWVDRDGVVHYGDKPKHDAEQLDVRPPGGGSPAADDEAAKAAQARIAECEKQKAQLDLYRKAPSIKETNSLGQTHEYSAEERLKFLSLMQQKVTEACAPPPGEAPAAEAPPAE